MGSTQRARGHERRAQVAVPRSDGAAAAPVAALAVDGAGGAGPAPGARRGARRAPSGWVRRFLANGAGVVGLVGVTLVVAVALAADRKSVV